MPVIGRGQPIEHGASASSRLFGSNRVKVALWIAVAEGIVAAFSESISRWTIVGLAIGAVSLYALLGRRLKPGLLRDVLWVFAFSQLLAVVAAVFAWILSWLAIVLAVVFAVAALAFLLLDRR
jgi:hypothetical protein